MRSERILDAIGDPARQNRFEVDIFAPGAWQQGAPIGPGAHDRSPSFKAGIRIRGIRCINAIIPGRSFTTAQFGEQGSGPKRSYPTGLDYAGQVIALTFICDTQFIDRRAIEAWQENIFNKRYGLNYPEEYYGTMTIRQLDRGDRPIYTINLHEVWPQGIVAQDLNMASGAIQTFTVNFNYRTWSSQFENIPSGILGGIFQKAKRRFGSRILNRIEDKLF